MSNRELLELAAKAAGYESVEFVQISDDRFECHAWVSEFCCIAWNPIEDDGDAFRLAVRLRFQIIAYKDRVEILQDGICIGSADSVYSCGCMPSTTRLAITRAAAQIGASIK